MAAAQAELVRKASVARRDAIAVDSFPLADFLRGAVTSCPGEQAVAKTA